MSKTFRMKNILGIGNALVDVITIVPDESCLSRFNLPKGSMTMVDASRSGRDKTGYQRHEQNNGLRRIGRKHNIRPRLNGRQLIIHREGGTRRDG
ncbi:MAG: hypothetical protein MZV63_67485 [Marinilabiliales bacterium]|nr:hypothetical protein [Marinilabiliales bacterium]